MKTHLVLTERDEALLQALVIKVRLFSLRQIARQWWNDDLANSRRRLRQLVNANLVISAQVVARSVLRLAGPVIQWKPGDPPPNFGAVAHLFQQRLRKVAARPTGVFIASERAARLFGGRCRGELSHPSQATHDLGVAAMWLFLAEHSPPMAMNWVGEDLLAHTRRGQKCPDAFLVEATGTISRVLEYGGDYDYERVERFHNDCAERQLAYEMW